MVAQRLTPRFSESLLEQATPVKIVFFDIDGVWTDGSLYFGSEGEQLKRFHTLDGHGVKLLKQSGIEPAVITGRDSQALRTRLKALGVTHAVFGTENKRPAAEQMLQSMGLQWSQAAAMGDDWPDLPVMSRCVIACAPPGAHHEALSAAHYVTQAEGGAGAVREFCDLLLFANGRYGALLQEAQSR